MHGLDISQAVVVNDLQQFRLLQTLYRLGALIMIHQNHALTAGTKQMIARQGTHNALVLIQDGICAETALQNSFPNIINIVGQMEIDQIFALADTADGMGMTDQTHCTVSVIRSGNDAGVGFHIQQLLADLGLTDHHTGDIQLQGTTDHLRLITANHNAVLLGEHQVFTTGRQRNGDLTGDTVLHLTALIEHTTLQNGEQVVDGDILNIGIAYRFHIVICHVAGRQHTVQGAVLVLDGQDADLILFHDVPCTADRSSRRQSRGGIKVQILDLSAQVGNQDRGLHAKTIQHQLGLITDGTKAGSLILAVTHSVSQRCIGQSGNNGVGVGVAMAGNINRIHTNSSSEIISHVGIFLLFYRESAIIATPHFRISCRAFCHRLLISS